MLTACPVRFSTTVCRTLGHCAMAASTMFFRGTTCPRRHAPSHVTTTEARASLTRSRTASAAKPPKITVCVAPMRAQASRATAISGTMPMYTATRSPARTPSFFSTLAKRITSRWSCW